MSLQYPPPLSVSLQEYDAEYKMDRYIFYLYMCGILEYLTETALEERKPTELYEKK